MEEIAPKIGLDAEINPEKETNPMAVDLLVDGRPTDLKNQQTPFFKAEDIYGVDNQYAVSFNVKDYRNYKRKGGDVDILFWVQ